MRMSQLNGIGVQEMPTKLSIGMATVERIAVKWVANRSEMSADLMPAAAEQTNS